MDIVKQFNDYRARMNEKISGSDSLIIKRIFNLDTNAYAPGVLDVRTKELIGLTLPDGVELDRFQIADRRCP